MDKWDVCAFPVNAEKLKGRACYAGLDLSSTTDITAFVLVFPPENSGGKNSDLSAGPVHYCTKGHEHSLVNDGVEDLVFSQ